MIAVRAFRGLLTCSKAILTSAGDTRQFTLLSSKYVANKQSDDIQYLDFCPSWQSDDVAAKEIIKDMTVYPDFITESEEKALIEEVEPYMKKLRYEFDHWDDAIHGYRETERRTWNEENTATLQKVRSFAFPEEARQLILVHVLDLAESGVIKPHIDSTRFCGNIIAGLSLLSSCVMRLVLEKEKTKYVDVFLARRSLYVMRDSSRYNFTHEVLGNENSLFRGQPVKKDRRVSIICRNEP